MSSHEACCGTMFWVYLLSCAGLVMFAGLMSGLTLGLMSLSLVDLEVLAKAGTPQDRLNAARIMPVVKNQHLLLCTLLIGNSLAMEALPIFLDSLVPSFGAILISVTLILAFGEIMPQAICTRYGLSMGAKAAPIVRVLLVLFFPVAYPISKLLDWLLGKGHVALMRRAELKTLVDMHGNEAGKGGELTHDETTIITGALEMTQKTAKDAMTPISETFSLDINAKLDLHTVGMIMSKGHSRIPIYSGRPSNIIGLILVKNLLTCRPEDEVPTRHVTIRKIPRVADDLPLYDILNEFQKGHSHMAVVVKRTKEAGESAEKNNGVPSDYKINHVHADDLSPSHVNIPGSRRNNTEKYGDGRPYSKKIERKRDNILDFNTDPLPCYSMDEEAVGIITMEDVMEELLQDQNKHVTSRQTIVTSHVSWSWSAKDPYGFSTIAIPKWWFHLTFPCFKPSPVTWYLITNNNVSWKVTLVSNSCAQFAYFKLGLEESRQKNVEMVMRAKAKGSRGNNS